MSLSGIKAPDRADRFASTSGGEVRFAHDPGSDRFPTVPGLIVTPHGSSEVVGVPIEAEDLRGVSDVVSLETRVRALWERSRDHLTAADVEEPNQRIALAGARTRQFFAATESALLHHAPSLARQLESRRLLRHMERELYIGRKVELEVASHDTYHPYDRPFIGGLQALARLVPLSADAPPEGEARVVAAVGAYVTDRKTVGRRASAVDERDLERSIHMRVISRRYSGQAVSISPYTDDPMVPWYAVMNIEGEVPESLAEHAGRAVFRDHATGEIFFDGTSELVPAGLVGHLEWRPTRASPQISVGKVGLPPDLEGYAGAEVIVDLQRRLVFADTGEPVPKSITGYITETVCNTEIGLRLLKPEERPRASFPYDWNRRENVNIGPIDISFAGHCHLKAQLEVFGLEAKSEVTLHNAKTGQTEELDAEEINDLLFALFDTDGYTNQYGNRAITVERGRMVGNRTMVRGASTEPQDRLTLELDSGKSAGFGLDIVSIDRGEIDLERAFEPTVKSDGAFVDNPAFSGEITRGWSSIDGDRPLSLFVRAIDVTPSGALEHRRIEVAIDPEKPSPEPILLGSERRQSRQVENYYYNQVTGTLESQLFAVERDAGGDYLLAATSERTPIEKVNSLRVSRELIRESVLDLHTAMFGMMRDGLPAIIEKTAGYAVWNYAISAIELTRDRVRVEEDGTRYVTYTARVTAGGSDKTWSYIVREDAEGNEVSAHAVTEPPDYFAFRDLWAAVPLYAEPDAIEVAVNDSARSRGYLPDRPMTEESMAFFAYASDVVYASLADPSQQERLVIRDADGQLYFYDSRAAFEADIAELAGEYP